MLWYEEEIKRLEKEIADIDYIPGVVFYGSSSITLWQSLAEDFKGYAPLNLGFGGSTLAACSWFFKRVFGRLQPTAIVVYAGDNDLGDGRTAEEVFLFYNELIRFIQQTYGDMPVGYISIKPSFTRWHIIDEIKTTNRLIAEEINNAGNDLFFINIYDGMTDKTGYPRFEFLGPDGLHINAKGYQLWTRIIKDALLQKNIPLSNS